MFGISGCGKSSIILRNLLLNNKNIIQINLAGCVRLTIDEFFKVILSEIYLKLDKDISLLNLVNFNDTSKSIINLLLENYANKEIYLVIEEIPIGDANIYEEFTEKLIQLIIYKSSFPALNGAKLILSSLNSPIVHIKPFQNKIKQHLKFIPLYGWEKDNLIQLVEIISKGLNLDLKTEFIIKLISSSEGSPRFIKAFFRNLVIINNFTTQGINIALTETIRDN